jgi:hypothetical protein
MTALIVAPIPKRKMLWRRAAFVLLQGKRKPVCALEVLEGRDWLLK